MAGILLNCCERGICYRDTHCLKIPWGQEASHAEAAAPLGTHPFENKVVLSRPDQGQVERGHPAWSQKGLKDTPLSKAHVFKWKGPSTVQETVSCGVVAEKGLIEFPGDAKGGTSSHGVGSLPRGLRPSQQLSCHDRQSAGAPAKTLLGAKGCPHSLTYTKASRDPPVTCKLGTAEQKRPKKSSRLTLFSKGRDFCPLTPIPFNTCLPCSLLAGLQSCFGNILQCKNASYSAKFASVKKKNAESEISHSPKNPTLASHLANLMSGFMIFSTPPTCHHQSG